MERDIYSRRTFRLINQNAGFLKMGARIEMLIDGQSVHSEVVYGDTLYAIGRYSRALAEGDIKKIDRANRLLPKRFQQPIIVDGK